MTLIDMTESVNLSYCWLTGQIKTFQLNTFSDPAIKIIIISRNFKIDTNHTVGNIMSLSSIKQDFMLTRFENS